MLGYLKYKSVDNAKKDETGSITDISMTQAQTDLKSARIYTYIGMGLLGVGATAFVASLFMRSRLYFKNDVVLVPLNNGFVFAIDGKF